MTAVFIFSGLAFLVLAYFSRNNRVDLVTKLYGGVFFLILGLLALLIDSHKVHPITVLLPFLIATMIGFFALLRWKVRHTSVNGTGETRKRVLGYLVLAGFFVVLDLLEHKGYVYMSAFFVAFALWEYFNIRSIERQKEQSDLPKSIG